MTEHNGNGGDFRLNGVTLDEGLKELMEAYLVQAENSDKAVPDHPVIVRQRRISKNVSGLEEAVKGSLGDSVKASKAQAEDIVRKLTHTLAQAEGYQKPLEQFTDEDSRKYLTNAASALGNPTIGNKIAFIESIMNLAAAKPGDPLYDANSVLAQLISYIATQQDNESRRITYIRQLAAERWQRPGEGIVLQDRLGHAFNLPLSRIATAGDAFEEINRRATLKAQEYAQTKTAKTYLQPDAGHNSAAKGH